MTPAAATHSVLERVLSVLVLVVFWTAFVCLAAGLGLWLWFPADPLGAGFLTAGLTGLISMPILRLTTAVATAMRTRDWILLAATLSVMGILCALTLRDAAAVW